MKKKSYKPTNKDRDKAISHVLGKMQSHEQILEAQLRAFGMFIEFLGKTDEFNKFYLEEQAKAKIENEERNLKEGNEKPLDENPTDEGRGSEGIREGK